MDRLVGAERLGRVETRILSRPLFFPFAVQTEPEPPSTYPATTVQGHELARLRRQLAPARLPDGVIHRRSQREMAGRAGHDARWAVLVSLLAILTALTLRAVFRLAYRQAEG